MTTNYDYLKDPDAVLDFKFDWSSWLEFGEEIVDSIMFVTTGMTIDSADHTLGATVAWLSGGTSGRTYKLTNRITTNSVPARIDDRSITIRVTNR